MAYADGVAENPSYVVFNGKMGSMTLDEVDFNIFSTMIVMCTTTST
jgi:hypothetical protein